MLKHLHPTVALGHHLHGQRTRGCPHVPDIGHKARLPTPISTPPTTPKKPSPQVTALPPSPIRPYEPSQVRRPEIQKVGPLSKVNLIIGQNNAGKSNILNFARWLYGAKRGKRPTLDRLDRPLGSGDAPVGAAFAVPAEGLVKSESISPGFLAAWTKLQEILGGGDQRVIWLQNLVDTTKFQADTAWNQAVTKGLSERELSQLNSVFSSTRGGGREAEVERIFQSLTGFVRGQVPVEYVPAFRQIAPRPDEQPAAGDRTGIGLIEDLAELERPVAASASDRDRFDAIQEFVRWVFDDAGLEIQVPHDRKTINIVREGAYLPLESFGTGMHQVVMIAVAATMSRDSLVLIEEPEVHMHPILQRKLLRYLNDSTSNQYLIATHSAHMLDSDIASIFHVTMTDTGSQVTKASTPGDLAEIAADLGYRASDLVQTNAIIWVEGPSDRVYLKHWLALAAAELHEGTHYSIMFYGGSLLSHLSGDESALDDFVKLHRLNRHVAIVIDSDLTSDKGSLNKSKKRVISEVEGHGGLAWVTWGYTIENYVPADILNPAIQEIHPSAKKMSNSQRSNPLGNGQIGVKHPAKNAIAREVVDRWPDQTRGRGDLAEKVSALAEFIKRANGSPVTPSLTAPGD